MKKKPANGSDCSVDRLRASVFRSSRPWAFIYPVPLHITYISDGIPRFLTCLFVSRETTQTRETCQAREVPHRHAVFAYRPPHGPRDGHLLHRIFGHPPGDCNIDPPLARQRLVPTEHRVAKG